MGRSIMERHVLTTTMISKRCAVCKGLDATVVPIERVPNNGIVMKAVHYGTGVTHTWLEYDSSANATASSHGVNIQCPKCGNMGRVYTYTPNFRKHPERVSYVVNHERIPGTWGKNATHFKSRRCYIGIKHRPAILKILGRYIPERDVPAHPRKYPKKAQRVECPKCHKPAVKYDSDRLYWLYEHVEETPMYYISKGKKKPRYRRCIIPKGNGGTNA